MNRPCHSKRPEHFDDVCRHWYKGQIVVDYSALVHYLTRAERKGLPSAKLTCRLIQDQIQRLSTNVSGFVLVVLGVEYCKPGY